MQSFLVLVLLGGIVCSFHALNQRSCDMIDVEYEHLDSFGVSSDNWLHRNCLQFQNCALSEELSGIGTLFSISGRSREDIVQAIKFFFGPLGFLKGIQAKISDEWSSRYGVPGGSESTITLYDGESIIRVSGRGKICIRFIELETSAGRIIRIGKPIGNYFDNYPPHEYMALSGIRGLYGITCMKKLQFDWSYIPEISTTTEIAETAETSVQTPIC